MSVRRGSCVLFRIHKLANLGALLIKIREVPLSQALIYLKFLLGAIFLASSYIRLAQTIVSIRQVRIQFARPNVLWYRVGILLLIRIKITQLQVGIRELRIEAYGLFQQGLNLLQIQIRVFSALALP
jgi:hypothetical protein